MAFLPPAAHRGALRVILAMFDPLRAWFRRYFSDPQIVSLTVLLVLGAGVVLLFGHLLAPLIAALVIAFVLDGAVEWLCHLGMPRLIAVWIMFLIFIAAVALFLGGMVPLLMSQISEFARELPKMIAQGQEALRSLHERYPHYISQTQVDGLISELRHGLTGFASRVLSVSLASVFGLITLIVYLIMVPFLVFFFLKDKYTLLGWLAELMPRQRALVVEVWNEVNRKFVGYVRGKILEILIIWAISFIAFSVIGLHYGLLLAVLVGLSVVIPYVGAVVVSIPLLFVGYIQWGLSDPFYYLLGAFVLIQFIDGNLLVPLLFSEMVSLHPVAIITAILLFGGLWGVWGVFFAIPLATLIQAVIHALRRAARAGGEAAPVVTGIPKRSPPDGTVPPDAE